MSRGESELCCGMNEFKSDFSINIISSQVSKFSVIRIGRGKFMQVLLFNSIEPVFNIFDEFLNEIPVLFELNQVVYVSNSG